MEYTVNPLDNDLLFTITEPGEYQGVVVKVVDLQLDEEDGITFDFELPVSKAELFHNDKFVELVQEMVGDAVKKSTDALVKQQEDIIKLEEEVGKVLSRFGIEPSEKLFVEQFMEKGYLLMRGKNKLDKESILAVEVSSNTAYDLLDTDDLSEVKMKIYPSVIIN